MKKSLLALAALTAFAGAASAQSSVTLFGIVDLNARSQKNGSAGEIASLSQDGNASSRLGFRGVEDLGGGLRAGFWIEGALNPDTGNAAGQTWQRRSTVSLLGGFGELRLGRDYTPTFWNHTVFDPFGTNGVGSQTNLIAAGNPIGSGAGTTVRANNTVGYFLPAMGGLYGQVQVAAGEGATGNKYFGGRIGYGAGPVNVAVAYGVTEQTGTMTDDYTAMNVGGSFNLGFMTLYGQYHMNEQGSNEQTMYLLGAGVPIGAGTLKATYGATNVKIGTLDADASQIAVGYVYDLSKRTSVYAHFSQVDNDAGLRFTTSGSGPSVAGISGFKSTGYEVGVRHSF
ncbi:porin [Rubrivivax sp. RP6-9]|uniref:porin n=1 Tax=Rubrivivax sp. RP6-9 TaxID=3415750 RepID=UPI003CC69FAC